MPCLNTLNDHNCSVNSGIFATRSLLSGREVLFSITDILAGLVVSLFYCIHFGLPFLLISRREKLVEQSEFANGRGQTN